MVHDRKWGDTASVACDWVTTAGFLLLNTLKPVYHFLAVVEVTCQLRRAQESWLKSPQRTHRLAEAKRVLILGRL